MARGAWLAVALAVAGCGAGGQAARPPAPVAQAPAPAWIAFGDSITAAAFAQPAPGLQVLNAGKPGADSAYAAAEIRAAIARDPQAAGVAIAFGTNDVLRGNDPASFKAMLGVTLDRAAAAGKPARLARIPWGAEPRLARVPDFNAAIDALARERGLAPGPDLYGWFRAHPEQLDADGVHPNAEGQAAVRRLWAAALAP